jgi:hypothetical protein
MAKEWSKTFDLDKTSAVACHLSADRKRLRVEFDVATEGLTKTGVNGLIDALEKVRDKMER